MDYPFVTVPPSLGDRAEQLSFIRAWEKKFDDALDEMSHAISRACVEEGVQVIRLSGPTCAGKTTTAAKLTQELQAVGCTVYPISLDDFFYGRDELNERAAEDGSIDYDSVNALDLSALEGTLHGLLRRGMADVPIYDFMKGDRVGYRTLDVRNIPGGRPVFLLEGIQAVYPEVIAHLKDIPDRSIFSTVAEGLCIGDRLFAPHEIRLMRRLVRDEAKRNSTPAFSLYLWHSVRANEEACILPYADACDYRVNSLMGFDVHMLAPRLKDIFARHPVPADSPDFAAAMAQLAKLEGIEGVSADLIAPNSLYHEFIMI